MERVRIGNITDEIYEWIRENKTALEDLLPINNYLCDNGYGYHGNRLMEASEFINRLNTLTPKKAAYLAKITHFDIDDLKDTDFIVEMEGFLGRTFELADKNNPVDYYVDIYGIAEHINMARRWELAEMVKDLADYIDELIDVRSREDGVRYFF